MTTIIADSGSTKTHWAVVEEGGKTTMKETLGINPIHMSVDEIKDVIPEHLALRTSPFAIRFFGAGCVTPFSEKVEKALKDIYPDADIFVGSDMLGAARALFGNDERSLRTFLHWAIYLEMREVELFLESFSLTHFSKDFYLKKCSRNISKKSSLHTLKL